jgi:hypothetical protein
MVFGLLAGVMLLAGESARADATGPKADILVIHALNTPGAAATDPALAGLKQLKNVPFNGYNVFKLLDTKSVPLVKTGGSVIPLANGYKFSLSLTSAQGNQLHIVPAIGKVAPAPLPEVTAKANEPFFVAGQSYQGGILIIAVTPHV